MLSYHAAFAQPSQIDGVNLRPTNIDISSHSDEQVQAAMAAFLKSCEAIAGDRPELRRGLATPSELKALCTRLAVDLPSNTSEAKRFFSDNFDAFEIIPTTSIRAGGDAFFTGYYEPVVDGSLSRTAEFSEPLRARPSSLVTINPDERPIDFPESLSVALRLADGTFVKVPERKDIEKGALDAISPPIAWVRDGIEAFMIHVQGSAAIKLADGRLRRLTYAGRNGYPYTSIGRILIDGGEILEREMTLARLKQWVREHGQTSGDAGRALMERNKSYIFFSTDISDRRSEGPIGAASIPLSSMASIAVDRTIWPYGLPFLIEAKLPEPAGLFNRIMIAQDTGSAIIGPARADLFIGTGDEAGRLAGDIRHYGKMTVLWPRSRSGQ